MQTDKVARGGSCEKRGMGLGGYRKSLHWKKPLRNRGSPMNAKRWGIKSSHCQWEGGNSASVSQGKLGRYWKEKGRSLGRLEKKRKQRILVMSRTARRPYTKGTKFYKLGKEGKNRGCRLRKAPVLSYRRGAFRKRNEKRTRIRSEAYRQGLSQTRPV